MRIQTVYNLNVTQKAITVTANAGQTKVYGAANPAYTYTITVGSLVGADTLTGALSRIAGESVGTYAITQGTLNNSNYSITFVPNNFAITQKTLTITANAGQSKVYGAVDPAAFTYNITSGSLVGADTLSGALSRVAGEGVGTYAITQGTLNNSNYSITYNGNNFAITQKTLTITANAGQTKVYGAANPVYRDSKSCGSLIPMAIWLNWEKALRRSFDDIMQAGELPRRWPRRRARRWKSCVNSLKAQPIIPMNTTWSPTSWQTKPLAQAVDYPDRSLLQQTLKHLAELPPLVTSWEVEALKTQLAEAHKADASYCKAATVASVLTTAGRTPLPVN